MQDPAAFDLFAAGSDPGSLIRVDDGMLAKICGDPENPYRAALHFLRIATQVAPQLPVRGESDGMLSISSATLTCCFSFFNGQIGWRR